MVSPVNVLQLLLVTLEFVAAFRFVLLTMTVLWPKNAVTTVAVDSVLTLCPQEPLSPEPARMPPVVLLLRFAMKHAPQIPTVLGISSVVELLAAKDVFFLEIRSALTAEFVP